MIIFVLLGILIYNEVIIIHSFQLDFYTSKKINERAESISETDINSICLVGYNEEEEEEEAEGKEEEEIEGRDEEED